MGMIFYTPKIDWFSRILELEFKNLSKIYLEYFQFHKNILLFNSIPKQYLFILHLFDKICKLE
jgi:hypothetical protein